MKEIMSNLKEFVKKREIVEIKNDFKFKILAIICIIFALYVAWHCVFLNFKVLDFLNPMIKNAIHVVDQFLVSISFILRNILMKFV